MQCNETLFYHQPHSVNLCFHEIIRYLRLFMQCMQVSDVEEQTRLFDEQQGEILLPDTNKNGEIAMESSGSLRLRVKHDGELESSQAESAEYSGLPSGKRCGSLSVVMVYVLVILILFIAIVGIWKNLLL
uniref:Uncharacterized protein n=1 Tax=Rhizophora mucronata TaxID=61149 RepID=A0A2P2KC63_RHIMU